MERADIALLVSSIGLIIMVVEKLFGGGNALAAKFHSLDKTTGLANEKLRDELNKRIDAVNDKLENSQDNYRVGLDAVTANIHALREGILELRAKMAEEYIAKGGLDDVKTEMQRGFAAVDTRIGQLQDLIMWAQPQTPLPGPHKR